MAVVPHLGIKGTGGVHAITNGANGAVAGYGNFMTATEALLTANAPMPTAAIMASRSLIKLAGLTDTSNQLLRKPELLANLPLIATPQIPINLTTGLDRYQRDPLGRLQQDVLPDAREPECPTAARDLRHHRRAGPPCAMSALMA